MRPRDTSENCSRDKGDTLPVFSTGSKKKMLWKAKAASDGWLVFTAEELRFSQVTSAKTCEDFVVLSSQCFFGG